MKRVEKRKELLKQGLRELVRRESGKEIDLDSLPPELSTLTAEPQERMRRTMSRVAERLKLHWSSDPPSGHPYNAKLDGALFKDGEQVALVELETTHRKQIIGSLTDLVVHPQPNKVLIIGRSVKTDDPAKEKTRIEREIWPVIRDHLASPPKLGIFTEDELNHDPSILGRFLELTIFP